MATVDHSLFGGYHIILTIVSVLAAVMAAWFAARFVPGGASSGGVVAGVDPKNSKRRLDMVLLLTGMLLAMLETFKQIYLYFSSGSSAYDWWYFPFQLCSVPMYLCILLPFVKSGLRSSFLTFMSGYTFVSAAAALVYPEDFLRPFITLTAHGFIWHGLLLFISLLIIFTGAADASFKGLLRAAALFAVLCAAAVFINVAAEPLMQAAGSAIPHSWTAMFYMNPYHISPQPLVGSVQKTAGIPAGLLLYAVVIAGAGNCVTLITKRR